MFIFIFTPFIKGGRYIRYSLIPLLFYPHFNVTCFFKVGITVSFFELYAILFFVLILLSKSRIKLKANCIDRFFITFLFLSLISLVIAIFRIYVYSDLSPHYILDSPILRGIMSLNRFIIFPFILIVIRTFYEAKGFDLRYYFIKYLAYSGFLPALAAIIQTTPIEFQLLFNNPSFGMNLGWSPVERPLGLTNEASFLSYMLFFSVLGVYFACKSGIIQNKWAFFLYFLYTLSIVVSISRTGLVVLVLFCLLKNVRKLNLGKIIFFTGVVLLLSTLSFSGFNILDRFVSTFDVEADLSTIERYGCTEALFRLAIDKSVVFGVGIFNYLFYVQNYLPSYALDYASDYLIPSFNFILQLWVEWGGLFLLMFLLGFYILFKKQSNAFVVDWFFYLFVFALSFQVFNFSLPFVIILYSLKQSNNIMNGCKSSKLL